MPAGLQGTSCRPAARAAQNKNLVFSNDEASGNPKVMTLHASNCSFFRLTTVGVRRVVGPVVGLTEPLQRDSTEVGCRIH